MLLSTILLSVTAITAVGGFFYAIYKIAKRIDGAVGVDSNGRTLSERMTRVEYQLWENGGASLKDDVNLIRDVSQQNTTEIKIVKELVLTMVEAHQEASEKKVARAKRRSA
jgi:hypothetical protein